ncbi:MAG: Type II secretion system protein E [Microgenomates group bacterium GW2011_GWA2_46_7]|nr:MAG: Type II secretion system protein E [Microgenomates group bacterium GW2011_GWA2_46_7]
MILPDDQLKEILLTSKIFPIGIIEEAFTSIEGSHTSLGGYLLSKHLLSEEQLGLILAKAMGVSFVVLSKLTIPPEIFNIVPPRLMRKNKIVPYAKDGKTLKVGMSDPRAKNIVEMLSKKTGLKIEVAYSTESDVNSMINLNKKLYKLQLTSS